MTSLIFLDFDGVLNSVGTKDRIQHPKFDNLRIRGIDRFRVELISQLAFETASQIVISSSWREFFTIKEIQDMLGKYGLANPRIVIGTTPLEATAYGWAMNKMSLTRGEEIELCLRTRFQPDHVLIIDDIVTQYRRYQIVTDDDTGFFKGHLKRARSILKLPYDPENLG